ncbi:MAG TPA: hypothetical protein VIJ92_17270 [Ginsengibacter sp.]
MRVIEHKFKNHQIKADTETLIIGTFNPNSPNNPADFFYGRNRNNFWKLLPIAFDNEILNDKTKIDKIAFSNKFKVDFIDLINSVEVEEGQETNYDDNYIDSRVIEWNKIIPTLSNLKTIKKICFTRKTLSDIPHMKEKILEIENYCKSQNIIFTYLLTPARFYNSKKQEVWNNFFKQ